VISVVEIEIALAFSITRPVIVVSGGHELPTIYESSTRTARRICDSLIFMRRL